jgi:hypothetical protein
MCKSRATILKYHFIFYAAGMKLKTHFQAIEWPGVSLRKRPHAGAFQEIKEKGF